MTTKTESFPRRGVSGGLLLSAALLVLAGAGCGTRDALVVAGAGVIDGTGAVWEEGVLVVEGGVVVCAGEEGECAVPAGAEVLDASGFWVVPGFIDVYDAPNEGPVDEQPAYMAFLLGVTTLAKMPSDALPVGSEDHRIPVPRPAIPASDLVGAAGVFERVVDELEPGLSSGDDARAVRVWEWSRARLVDRDALLEEAAAAGAGGGVFAPSLVVAEHMAGPYRLPHGMNRLLEHSMVTLRIQDRLLPNRTAEEAAALSEALSARREFVKVFHDAGGRVVTATLGALAPGLAVHEEMDALVTAGLSPEDALYAATREAAVALGLDESRGTLEPGKLADFAILEGDPRLDIAHTQTVSRVAKGGVLYDPPTLFDALLDSPGSRVTQNPVRLVIAGIALALVLGWIAWALRSHAGRVSGGSGPQVAQ